MTDRPMIFSGPMVRALLDGSKTQTRRVIRPYEAAPLIGRGDKSAGNIVVTRIPARHGGFMQGPSFKLHYAPGDRVWVREAHGISSDINRHDGYVRYTADNREWHTGPNTGDIPDGSLAAWFRVIDRSHDKDCGRISRPSIHMPRWASRITLHITDVRVQRLQDISEADAVAEGAPVAELRMYPALGNARHWFCDLWNSLHGADAWATNPWVCALTFTVQRRNIDSKGESQ